jgi:hypothetical protein
MSAIIDPEFGHLVIWSLIWSFGDLIIDLVIGLIG